MEQTELNRNAFNSIFSNNYGKPDHKSRGYKNCLFRIPKPRVAGSIPVARSSNKINRLSLTKQSIFFLSLH